MPSCLSLREALRGWTAPLAQHDAGENLQFLLTLLQPPAFQGSWDARLTEPFAVVDGTTPVILHPEGGALPDLIAKWHLQYAVHAIHSHSLVVFRIVRYGFGAALMIPGLSGFVVTTGRRGGTHLGIVRW